MYTLMYSRCFLLKEGYELTVSPHEKAYSGVEGSKLMGYMCKRYQYGYILRSCKVLIRILDAEIWR